jgi:hypothetical protein
MLTGLFGVEVQWNDAHHHFDPSTILEKRFAYPGDLLDELCRASGLFESAWRDSLCSVRKVTWLHLCGEHPDRVRNLVAMRTPPPERADVNEVQSFIDDGASFLMNNQRSSGDYCYLYDAMRGEGRQSRGNTVRSSGCAYAMAKAVRAVRSELRDNVLGSARRAITAILARTAPWSVSELIVRERLDGGKPWGKLGSTALAAVALLELEDPEFYPDALEGLLAALKRAQGRDGFFDCFPGAKRAFGTTVNYYPGEALLALAMSASRGDIQALECCRRAFLPYRRHFLSAPGGAFLGWHVDVWSRVAMLTGNEAYAEFVFEQLDWIAPFQTESGLRKGGFSFDRTEGGVASTVYTEAMIRGAHLAHIMGMGERAKRYAASSLAGLQFCTRLQLTPDSTVAFPELRRMTGGVTSNFRSFLVRADNVQHMMTMAQAAIECFDGIEGLWPTHQSCTNVVTLCGST